MDTHDNTTKIRTDKESEDVTEDVASKKPFVEPEISLPIDVLEATTFQAVVTTGATN